MIQKLICQVLIFNFVFLFPYIPNVEANPEAKNAAIVKVVKGKAFKIVGGKKSPIKKKEWLKEGTTIQTEDKSFVRLVYTDKSSMNVGPSSEMKIEQFDNKEPGMINVIKGKIRSKVSKDYLKIDKKRSKLLVRTPTAVMGVRGTEFVAQVGNPGGKTVSSLMVVEGTVMMANIDPQRSKSQKFPTKFADNLLNKKGVPAKIGNAAVVTFDPKAKGKKSSEVKMVTLSKSQLKVVAESAGTEKEAVAEKKPKKEIQKKKLVKNPPGITDAMKNSVDPSSEGSALEKSLGATAGVATETVKEAVEQQAKAAPPVNEVVAADGTKIDAKPVAFFDPNTGISFEGSENAVKDASGNIIHDPGFAFDASTGEVEIAGGIEINPETGTIVKEVVDSTGQVKTVKLGDMNTSLKDMEQVMQVVEQGVEQMSHDAGAPPPLEGPAPASIDGEAPPPGEGDAPPPPPEGEIAPDGTALNEPEVVNDFLDPTFTNGAGAGQVLIDSSNDTFIDNQIQQNTTTTVNPTPGSTTVNINVQ